ncbi:SRPBCC domain-containing protein [Cellulomonas massiliensis]|uniref:SRPBCC domain-containing protein n=1 Tax=Cellulomonas massiliensis TaxID=1465811 RepID=UPI0003059B6C|nr:SRPBCC domain-containing protein [Cellulomonas massiliensis]
MAGLVARAQRRVAASPERVWEVLTSPDPHPEILLGARTVSDWRVGGPVRWVGEWQGRPFEDQGEVVEVDRPRRLVVTHYSPMSGAPDVPESYHRLTYELSPDGDGTLVSLEQDNNPDEEAVAHSARTWEGMLDGVATVAERA